LKHLNRAGTFGIIAVMCRNIKTLHHFEPPATEEEIRASALQFVRKLSGMQKPSHLNQVPFEEAVRRVFEATSALLAALEAKGPKRTREQEKAKAQQRGVLREQALRKKLAALSV
jgi:hypothetical protein